MRRLAVLFLAALLSGCVASGSADRGPSLASAPAEPLAPTVQEVPARAYAAFVMDARTGKILHDTAGRSPRYPASLTKMMTLYMVFEKLESGAWTTRTALPVSEEAASRPPSKLGVKAGTTISVDMAARALAVRSANDVAVVVAEAISGSEEAFAQAMTRKARSLGMAQTRFANASGLPDPGQVTTARDVAILGKALSDRFPRWFRYFSTGEVTYNGRTWRNTNRLLRSVDGMDGIKTGYIRASGYNLCASVRRSGKHIIAVVIGGRSGTDRNRRMEALIEEYLPEASGGGLFASLF
jgi:D-alanyl-D-alanine carboxypeptidase